MKRTDMIITVGKLYHTSNIENDEFSYPKAYRDAGLHFTPIVSPTGRKYENLDIRFEKDGVSVLIETKTDYTKDIGGAKEQLSAYVEYEKGLTSNKVIAILANTSDDSILVWRGVVSDSDFMQKETAIRGMSEYVDFYTSSINDKERVMQNTYKLNELLFRHSIQEKKRLTCKVPCLSYPKIL